jgi:hypothetical protein
VIRTGKRVKKSAFETQSYAGLGMCERRQRERDYDAESTEPRRTTEREKAHNNIKRSD